MSEENDEKWRSYALDNRNKITELEKKFKNLELSVKDNNDWITDNDNIKERIEKLEKDAKDHDLYQQDQYDIIKQELSELSNRIKRLESK